MILSETALPLSNVHAQFANFFGDEKLKPFLQNLSQRMAEGHVCLDLKEQNEDGILKVLPPSALVGKAGEQAPFIQHDQKLYLQRYFSYETDFLEAILKMVKNDVAKKQQRLATIAKTKPLGQHLAALFQKENLQNTDWQLAGCMVSYLNQFSIITGGPGTGKTTTIRKLIALLMLDAIENQQPKPKVLLAAPTGKAAARMKQSLGDIAADFSQQVGPEITDELQMLEPTTIHRMLGYMPNCIYFKHGPERKLDADVLIIDECSMIDIALFAKLMSAIDTDRTKLILLGDRNQLASVDAGSLFGDLCESLQQLNEFDTETANAINQFLPKQYEIVPEVASSSNPLFGKVVELQHSYRFSDDKGIGAFSKAVLAGDVAAVAAFYNDKEEILLSESEDAPPNKENQDSWVTDFAAKLQNADNGYINEPDTAKALSKINYSKILCATRKGPNGTTTINQEIAAKIKNKKGGYFYENQLLMVLKNQQELGIYNGDVGIVRLQPGPTFYLENNKNAAPLHLAAGNIDQATDAYAMTIHKSQGSEFDHVLVVIPDNDEQGLLSRELLYTAVTRAKKSVVITGSREVILKSVARKVSRISGIQNRLSA